MLGGGVPLISGLQCTIVVGAKYPILWMLESQSYTHFCHPTAPIHHIDHIGFRKIANPIDIPLRIPLRIHPSAALGILLSLKASGHWELMSHRLAAVPPASGRGGGGGRVRSVLISGLAQAAKWNEALAFFQQMLGEIWV